MPVSQSNIGRQQTVAGLVKTLFDVKGEPELQKRAEEALLRANPGLVEGELKPGTPIIVPDLRDPHTVRPGRETVLPAEAVRAVNAGAAALVDLAGARLDAALKEAVDSAKMLKTKAAADAIATDRPDLKGKLTAIAAEAEQEAKRATANVAKLRAAIARFKGAIPNFTPR